MVTTLDETRHGLEDGDYVTFSEIQGMEGLNDAEPRKISVKGTSIAITELCCVRERSAC